MPGRNLFLYFRKNDYPKALDAFANYEGETDGYYLFLELLNGRYTKSRAELDRHLSITASL